jgi:uncharacterized protein
MPSRLPFLAFALLALGGFASPASAAVEDRAAFFSAGARNTANQRIADLERTYGKSVAVETFTAMPDDVQKSINLEGASNTNRVYVDWATRQARARNVNGIYVLLVKNPAHLQAIVGKDTAQRAFTMQDRDALASLMLSKLRQKQNDAALLDGVEFVATTLRAHAPARNGSAVGGYGAQRQAPERERSSGLGWLLPLILVGVAVWVVLGIFRAIFNRGSGGAPYGGSQYGGGLGSPMNQGGGGGGFMRGLMGGMLGGAAGAWMYNSFFGGSHSAYGGEDRSIRSGDDSGPAFTGRDTDYTSSGGDYGGGGDFGGGGDSGGGGGDFGGGGGGGGDF